MRTSYGWLVEEGVNQIKNVVEGLKKDPNGRRHIVSAWNVTELPKMALPPCHVLFQFHVLDGKLSCTMTMRSCDLFLGAPFNIASYALLTHMIAQVVGLEVGELVIFFGNLHLYENHLAAAEEYLSRTTFPLPRLQMVPIVDDIFGFRSGDFALVNYQSHPSISGEIAV